jgi:cell surface protein SprA
MKSLSHLFLPAMILLAQTAFSNYNTNHSTSFYTINNLQVDIDDEFARFIAQNDNPPYKSTASLTDSIETFEMPFELKIRFLWFLSSTPQKQTEAEMFPEANPSGGLANGYNRAWLAWYIIDPLFYEQTGNLRPPNIDMNELSDNFVRQVLEMEVSHCKDNTNGVPIDLHTLDLVFYPSERGPYNFDVEGIPGISAGIEEDGSLRNPETRWGGIMRKFELTDFETINVQYIKFWLMDPFTNGQTTGGDIYFNLGDISEDVLRDSRKAYETGLPTSAMPVNVDVTVWGRVPTLPASFDNFSNIGGSRAFQDVGLDGLRDEDELTFFDEAYLQKLEQRYGANSGAFTKALTDPSNDNFHYFRGSDYDNDPIYSSVLERYKRFSGTDGNSPTDEQNPEPYPVSATSIPDAEDINRDNVLNETENYFQYKISLDPNNMQVGAGYISDVYHAQGIPLPNGNIGEVKWYQFKIPIHEYSKIVGDIQDFKSIRFMRIFLKSFYEPTVLRFATLELVRIVENPDNFEMVIFPNPAKSFIKVDFPEPIFKKLEIRLIDVMGNTMYEEFYPLSIYKQIYIDISMLKPGVYVFMLSTSTRQIVRKVVFK